MDKTEEIELQDENFNSEIDAEEQHMYQDSTYEIVSKVAYLIGVEKRIFELERSTLKISTYEKLELDKNARIIRNLCLIRWKIEKYYKYIEDKIRYEYKSISSIPEYIPKEILMQLSDDGVNFIKHSSVKLFQHIIEINRIINDRINNCKSIFPLWLNWDFIKKLFIMPDGLSENGVKNAADLYYANKSFYPFGIYINWVPKDLGNILYSDKKFVSIVYEMNGEHFEEYSKVSDANSYVKGNIYDFIEDSEKVVVMVDCENSDPYKLSAAFRNLDQFYTDKISSIILFDDIHTATTWRTLEKYISIPVEHTMTERVKENKSLVDIMLTARACREHYQNQVDSFLIVSSDSDYWALISSLPEANFLVMIESEKCGPDLKNALEKANIFYCYIDDFYSGNLEDMKQTVLFQEMYKYIDNNIKFNLNEMFEHALIQARIYMTEAEKRQFYNQHLKKIQMSIQENGDVQFSFKPVKY